MSRASRTVTVAAVALAALALAIDATSAHAQRGATADFWREVTNPGHRRALELVRQAHIKVLLAATELPTSWTTICRALADDPERQRETLERAARREASLSDALVRFEQARALEPNDPEILFEMAVTLSRWERARELPNCSVDRKDDEAAELFERIRRIDPGYQADEIAFELGVIATRRADFAAAAREYARAIELSFNERETGLIHSNLAEVTMLAGDLPTAVRHYERAVELARADSSTDGKDYRLALWGLAVALDRLGEHRGALDRAHDAIQADGGTLEVLRSDGVFFVPDHELHYYEALGYEARAAGQTDEAARTADLRSAVRSWELFLSEGGGESRWADDARAHLRRIQERANRRPRARQPRGRPQRQPRSAGQPAEPSLPVLPPPGGWQ